ncbi:hypothetical protein [Mucilaginibacter sp.]|uniref:glycoside hydrolase family 130 protein n=1 Tax=Mucilaginibacter sp. TaxID=1882438 RepID=UPI003265E1BC
MIQVKKEGIIISKTDLVFESDSVLNPATIKVNDDLYLFYRAVQKGNFSSIGLCKLSGPLTVAERYVQPVLSPLLDIESQGMEDPRVVQIDDLYYLTYTAYDGVNAMGALATSANLVDFTRHGIIVPVFSFTEFKNRAERSGALNEKYGRYAHDHIQIRKGKKVLLWDKDVVFFPRRINGQLYFLHRIKPDIQIVAINELADLTKAFWNNYCDHFSDHIVLAPKHDHEVSYIGSGCPPVETDQGWLVIYHGVHDTTTGYVYSACAALLDLNNPKIEIARLPYPLFAPGTAWELNGVVDSVCFPSGTALYEDTLYIYYGAADSSVACASVSLRSLLNELLKFKIDKP